MTDIFIDKKSLAEIREIIQSRYPKAVVWAYGSRVAGGASSHGGSDLDLTVKTFGQGKYSLAELKEAFKESDIPFLIDISDFNNLPSDFQKEIQKKYTVIYSGETDKQIAVIKIKLMDIEIPIWRRIETPIDITLHQLHNIIQEAMGWLNYHLYSFYFRKLDINYTVREEDQYNLPNDVDSKITKLSEVWNTATQCIYTYDFGDNWEHEIKFERIIPVEKGVKYPRCAAGKGECPPEDIGSVSGYEHFIKVIKEGKSEEKNEYKEWLYWNEQDCKEFDPNHFDIDEANERIDSLGPELLSENEKKRGC